MKAMRYYRLWIYTCNAGKLLKTISSFGSIWGYRKLISLIMPTSSWFDKLSTSLAFTSFVRTYIFMVYQNRKQVEYRKSFCVSLWSENWPISLGCGGGLGRCTILALFCLKSGHQFILCILRNDNCHIIIHLLEHL